MLWELECIKNINRELIWNIFKLPYIESSRPSITNNPVSKETIWLDVITEYNKTLHSWMIYIQEDIFSKAFWVKYLDQKENQYLNPYIIHFGFTDNLLMAILLNSFSIWENKKLVLPNSLMPYHIICTSQDTWNNFCTQIKQILDSNWINLWSYRSFEYWTSKNKNILNMINKQNPYIHIKDKWENKDIMYRIQWQNERRNWSIADIIKTYHQLKDKRNEKILSYKKDIESTRIIETSSIIWINKLVAEWYVIKTPLKNNENNILQMEKILTEGEILWFTKNSISSKCILTNQPTSDIAFISKRL